MSARTKPPSGHDRACSTIRSFPQPSQDSRKPTSISPYLSQRLSQNSSSESSMPFRRSGTTVSQAPVS
eukprot:6981479-Ditylum_brightwellii.AAC.1